MSLMLLLMEHVNKSLRKFVPHNQKFCVTLDGHSSRNGAEWLRKSEMINCEIVQTPSDTSNFPQPCDQNVNRNLKAGLRDMRDKFCVQSLINLNRVQIALILGVAGFRNISPRFFIDSFTKSGLWPMNYNFLFPFREEKRCEGIQVVISRDSDEEVLNRVKSIVMNP